MPLERSAAPRDSKAPVNYDGDTREPAVKTGKPRVFKPIHVPETPRGKHRLRLVKPGWNAYNGVIAGAEFKNGLSVEKLPETIVDRVAALFSVEDEGGNPVGFRVRATQARSVEIASPKPMQTQAEVAPQASTPDRSIYQHDDLLDIADKKGIAGLREIADPLGVKGRAIPDLIQAILKTQAELTAGVLGFVGD